MTITPQQRTRIDREIQFFAVRANIGIVDVSVRVAQAHDSNNVFLNLYHGGHRADHTDWSMLATQLEPSGDEPAHFQES